MLFVARVGVVEVVFEGVVALTAAAGAAGVAATGGFFVQAAPISDTEAIATMSIRV